MRAAEYIQKLKKDPGFMSMVTSWHVEPSNEASYADFPEELDERIKSAMASRGIERLYTHQSSAVRHVLAGEDVVVVTPTASGKTLCYNLPVLNSILKDDASRALYLFPTKALSQDQVTELYELIQAMGAGIKAYTYDGDTPAPARTAIRQAGHIVVTNPDMLHQGILPHHTRWVKLFENLKYVVIDEIHAYRGIFGSNLANVITRLKRICDFYGAHPVFICCSATIRNPKELAEKLTGKSMTLIDNNGAPHGERHIVFVNPPVVNEQLGIRESSIAITRSIALGLLRNNVSNIVFARARLTVEVLVKYLKEEISDPIGNSGRVRGYRSGYLPTQRREIERELRQGNVTSVVSTNALELGIDIGQLDACVLCGYPGTIASTWQQAGRAGRRGEASLLIVVAESTPLDQYIVNHPDYFFGQSPENALINPENLYIRLNHLKCAAYELPFKNGELFADSPDAGEMLGYLEEEHILRNVAGMYYWMAEEFPQVGINLRTASDQNFVIVDITDPARHKVIGEMDRYTVPMLLHQYAIYMHEGQQYQVEELDFDDKKAYVRHVEVGYYTDADLTTSLKVLDEFETEPDGKMLKSHGEVLVSSIVSLFKKIRFDTHENLGWGPVTLPELEMQTTACWWVLQDGMELKYGKENLKDAMVGLAHILRHIAPLRLMCAPHDISVVYHVKDTFTGKPTVYLYDCIAGGIGLSDAVYNMSHEILLSALDALRDCKCRSGCPGCVGAAAGPNAKKTLICILEDMLENETK